MKTTLALAASNGIATLLASGSAMSDPSSDAATGWWMVAGISAVGTVSTIVANYIIFRNRNAPVTLSNPVLVEMRRELATKADFEKVNKFTGFVQKKMEAGFEKNSQQLKEEVRRLYDKIDPIESGMASLNAEAKNLREDVRELRQRITP